MSVIREVLFSLLFNAILQAGLFAVVAAAFSPFIKKARARYQHSFYLGVLALCLAAPVMNTFGRTRLPVNAEDSQQKVLQQRESAGPHFWVWESHSRARIPIEFGPGMQSAMVAMWGFLVLYGSIHFGRGIHRVHRLRKEASPLSPGIRELIAGYTSSLNHCPF